MQASSFPLPVSSPALPRLGIARDLVADTKVFSFSGGENDRGRFLRIFESGGGYPAGGSSLMIAAGGQLSNLAAFGACVHNVLAFVNEFAVQVSGKIWCCMRLFVPRQYGSGAQIQRCMDSLGPTVLSS